MPKKQSTQLDEVESMIADAVSRGPLTSQRKKAILKDIQEKFNCTEKTAYYYYFYKAQKRLEADGVQVMAHAIKTEKKTKSAKSTKSTKSAKSTDDLIADLPRPMVDAMKAGSPFAQLLTA
jgi:hypothetical protein